MKTHVLTGATSGIGAALGRALADRGDRLVLLARTEATAATLAADFAGAQVLLADLADPGTLNGLGRQVDGPVDSLLHVAGVVELAPVSRLRLHDWEEQIAVNLTSPAVLTREFLPHLRASSGIVLFVNSSAGLTANADWSAYAASKFGLRALADALRAEEMEYGVRVTTIYPSRTATPMQEKVHEQEGRTYDASRWIAPETVVLLTEKQNRDEQNSIHHHQLRFPKVRLPSTGLVRIQAHPSSHPRRKISKFLSPGIKH